VTVVVDASIVVRWLLKLPGSDDAEAMVASADAILAPDVVISETASALWKAVVFADLERDEAAIALQSIDRLFDQIVPSQSLRMRAFAIATELRHPVYDCFYLALAEDRSGRLLTADKRLARRCEGTAFGQLVRSLK
jgi:predicted nucleic acid-binding protein